MLRAPLAVAAALTLALAGTGSAAPKPQITDPSGDAVALGARYDVVSALFTTAGTVAKSGRRTVYTPTKLMITVTYAADAATDPYAMQAVSFDTPGCQDVYLEAYNGTTYGTADCIAESFTFTAKTAGRTVTFAVPFALIGKSHLHKGAILTELRTYTALAEPAFGYETGEIAAESGMVDLAKTSATYTIA